MQSKVKQCLRCAKVKPIDEFSRYDRWNHTSKTCLQCQSKEKRKEVVIYKDGFLNTKQERGFNWMLGYALEKVVK